MNGIETIGEAVQKRIAQLEAELAATLDMRDQYAADVAEWHEWLASVVGGMSNKDAMRAKLSEARKPKLCETCRHYCRDAQIRVCMRVGSCACSPPAKFGCVHHETRTTV